MTSPTANLLNGITYGNNTFVGGAGGDIVRSTDNGSSFSSVTIGQSTILEVAFGNNTFVAVRYDGSILRSTDNGTTWDNATSPTAEDLWGVVFQE